MIYVQTRSLNPLQKALGLLFGLATLALGVMFSVILIPLLVLLAVIGGGYFWWKTRALRKAMADIRMQQNGMHRDDGIIEGEAVVVREPLDVKRLSE